MTRPTPESPSRLRSPEEADVALAGSAGPGVPALPIRADTIGDREPPLGVEELARADRVARRIHGEFTALLAALPREARTASGLARLLGVDRTTCQRAVFVASRPYPGVEVLARLPGVRGLQQLADATAGHPEIEESAAVGLAGAVAQLDELIRAAGGSQARLVRRLERAAMPPEPASVEGPLDGGTGLGARMRLFQAAAELTGRSSACWVAVYIYRPSAGDPRRVELIRANGLVGHVARADAVPLVVHNFTTRSEEVDPAPSDRDGAAPTGRFLSLGNEPLRGRTLDSLLPEFTSDPPPIIGTRQPNEFLVQSIDEPSALAGRPVDLMMATRTLMPHPALASPSIEEAWALVNFPCRHLVFDLYLHRDLARACIPSLDAHLWRPDFAQHVGDRWQTRFAEAPTLRLLGPGLRNLPVPAYPRLGELTRHLFGRVDVDPEGVVGYRCEVAYPIWRAGYCVSFDFTQPQRETG